MAMRMGGARRKTSHMYSKPLRAKGKISIRKFLQLLSVGDKVLLKSEPAYQQGIYFRRYHGKTGTVVGQQGSNYKVAIDNFGQMKTIIVHPAHLVKQE